MRRGEFSVVALLSFAAVVRVVDRLCRGWRTWLGDGRSGSQFSDGVVVRVCVAERRSVLEVAKQAGHSPTMALTTYGHVIEELEGT